MVAVSTSSFRSEEWKWSKALSSVDALWARLGKRGQYKTSSDKHGWVWVDSSEGLGKFRFANGSEELGWLGLTNRD